MKVCGEQEPHTEVAERLCALCVEILQDAEVTEKTAQAETAAEE